MNIIEVKNLSIKSGEKQLFQNLNLKIKKGRFTTIIGLNGSGKTTLIKVILGLVNFEGNIKIVGLLLDEENKIKIREKIGVVFEKNDSGFEFKKVIDNIAANIKNLKPNEAKKKVKDFATRFGITNLLEKNVYDLNDSERGIITIVTKLVNEPQILILDEAFNRIEVKCKKQLYEKLNYLSKQGMTIINITHDMDDLLYCDDVIVIKDGNAILKGPKEEVLLEEKIFNNLNLELPFMASLSIKLKYYGLVDKIIFDMDEMVNEIWK